MSEFPPREISIKNSIAIVEAYPFHLLTEEYYNELAKSLDPHSEGYRNLIYMYELQYHNSYIIGPYISIISNGEFSYRHFSCLICDFENSNKTRKLSPNRASVENHVFYTHGIGRTPMIVSREISNEDDKWYWDTIATATHDKSDLIQLYDWNGIPLKSVAFELNGFQSSILLTIRDYYCNFCGDEYGTPPSVEIILTHLRQCGVVGEVARAVERGYTDFVGPKRNKK